MAENQSNDPEQSSKAEPEIISSDDFETEVGLNPTWPVADVTGADVAFGGDIKKIMPPMDIIPEEFRNEIGPACSWCGTVAQWFYKGGKVKTAEPKEGIDKNKAIRHVGAILASFEPKHEHKMAATAWLLSIWFDKFEIEPSVGNENGGSQ